MCDDVEGFTAAMETHGIACGAVQNQGWGLLTQLTLPGGGKLGVYQPRHARPKAMRAKRAAKKKPARRSPGKARRAARRKTA